MLLPTRLYISEYKTLHPYPGSLFQNPYNSDYREKKKLVEIESNWVLKQMAQASQLAKMLRKMYLSWQDVQQLWSSHHCLPSHIQHHSAFFQQTVNTFFCNGEQLSINWEKASVSLLIECKLNLIVCGIFNQKKNVLWHLQFQKSFPYIISRGKAQKVAFYAPWEPKMDEKLCQKWL